MLRVFVDAISPRALEFFLPTAARQQSHDKGANTTGCRRVPNAVADDHSVRDVGAQPVGGCQEQVAIGLCMLDLIACTTGTRDGSTPNVTRDGAAVAIRPLVAIARARPLR